MRKVRSMLFAIIQRCLDFWKTKKMIHKISIDLEKISKEPDAALCIGWLMAANDLAMAFYMQDHFIKQQKDREIFLGREYYAIRLIAAHTAEATMMALPCRQSKLFQDLISSYGRAKEAFDRICKFHDKPRPDDIKDLAKLLFTIRNKGTFHYYNSSNDELLDWMKQSIERRVRDGYKEGAAIVDDCHLLTRYAFADDVFIEVFFQNIMEADSSSEQALDQEIKRLSKSLIDAAYDIRVIGDSIGKALLARYPAR